MVTKEIIEQAISNGTLNPKMLDQFMRDMKIRAFTYDYQIQKDLVNYHEHRFTINPLKWELIASWSTRRERCYPVTIKECQVLAAGTKDTYLRSSLYNKYLTPEEVTANMKFFRNSFLIFVDGNIYTDYRVKISVDKVEILFRYKDLNKFAHLDEDPDVKLDGIATDIRIMVLPNAINAVAETLEARDFTGNVLYPNGFPSTAVAKFKSEYNYFGFWINKTNQHHFFIPYITWNDQYKYFTLPDAPPTDVTKYSIMIIGMDLIFKILDLQSTDEWFGLNSDKMPLPKDDIAIFIKSESFDTYVPNDTSVTLKEYYPNIYQVSNPNGYTLKMIAFYDMKPHNDHIYFDNEISPYLRLYDNLSLQYKEGTVPDLLKEYKPIDWLYSFQDMFKETPYKDVDFNNLWDGFLYKMHTIESILKRWMLFYVEYQRRTYGFLPGWYHKMSNYTNLNKKVRTSTLPEIPDPDFKVDFHEPQYIFSYKNTDISGDVKSFNWFIDGKFTIPTYTGIYHGYQYVYFPTSKISATSVIEVERFDGVKFTYSLSFDSIGDSIEIDVIKLTKYPIIINSIFFIDSDGNYLNRDSMNKDFIITVIDDELGEVTADPLISVFNLLPTQKLRITANNSNAIGKDIQLKCRNQVIKYWSRESGIDWERDYYENINLNEKKNILHVKPGIGSRLRVYTNEGRLIPKISYRVYNIHNYQETPKFNIPMRPRDDMTFMVNYIGYDERLVFHREYTYPNGYIDLRGRLSRPFSLAYHDVYLDGYRLTKYDIDQISPHSFVITAAHRLHTKSCVEIYEKSHNIDDYVKFEYDEESKYIMDELVASGAMNDAINNTYPPIDTESYNVSHVDDIIDTWYDLIRNYLIFKFLNGDKRYDYGRWSHIFDIHSGRAMLNADDRVRYIRYIRTMFYLSHDKTIAGETTPEPNRDYDGILYPYDPTIEMDEKDYQENSYYVTKYNPVFDEEFDIIPDPGLEPTKDKEDASEEDKRYIPDGDFHHIDTVDRNILTPEELEWVRKNSKYNPWLLDLDMLVTIEDGTVIDMMDDGTGSVRLEDKIELLVQGEEGDAELSDIVIIDKDYIDVEHSEIDPSDTTIIAEGDDVDYGDIHTAYRTDTFPLYLSMLETTIEGEVDWNTYNVIRDNGRAINPEYDLHCLTPSETLEPKEVDTTTD